jgi:excisionase family DNA binding protein
MDTPDGMIAVTVEEAARRISLGRDAMYALVESGRVPSVRIGRRIIVLVRGLEDAMEAMAAERAEEIARRPQGKPTCQPINDSVR